MNKRFKTAVLAGILALVTPAPAQEVEGLPAFAPPPLSAGEGYRVVYEYHRPRTDPSDPAEARIARRLAEASPQLLGKSVRAGKENMEIRLQWENRQETQSFQIGNMLVFRRPYPPQAHLSSVRSGSDPAYRDFEGGFGELGDFITAGPPTIVRMKGRECLLYQTTGEDGKVSSLWVDRASRWPLQMEDALRRGSYERLTREATEIVIPEEYSAMIDYLERNAD